MFVVDRAVGYAFNYMIEHNKGGFVGHHQYMSNEMKKDMLIMGSSRANHHYNPRILEDSLHLNCYNCGQDGNGIIFNFGQWLLISERYNPKYIIYDITPDFDCLKGDNHKYLGWLKLYWNRQGIENVFNEVDETEKIKMLSKIYQYNYNPLQFVADYIHPIYQVDSTGYVPLKGELDPMQIKVVKEDKKKYEYDSVKLSVLEDLIDKRKGAKIIFVVSPIWYGMDKESFKPIEEICKKKGCLFLDFSQDLKYVHHDEFFKDGMHLNEKGADEFTKDLISKIVI